MGAMEARQRDLAPSWLWRAQGYRGRRCFGKRGAWSGVHMRVGEARVRAERDSCEEAEGAGCRAV